MQEKLLLALSDQGGDSYLRPIANLKQRAERITARHISLYFESAAKSHGKVHFH